MISKLPISFHFANSEWTFFLFVIIDVYCLMLTDDGRQNFSNRSEAFELRQIETVIKLKSLKFFESYFALSLM